MDECSLQRKGKQQKVLSKKDHQQIIKTVQILVVLILSAWSLDIILEIYVRQF